MSLADALLLEACPLDVWIALRTDGAKGSGTDNDPFNGAPRYETARSVTQLTFSGRTATATSTGHGYSDNDVITISGATGADAKYYNGTFVIYGVSANSFNYWMAGVPAANAAGTITCARTHYRFDEVLTAMGTNTAIHVGPGVFLTRGYKAFGNPSIKPGQRILGSGMGVTTLKLVNVPVGQSKYAVLGTHPDLGQLEYFEASDLTLDCNLDGQLIKDYEFPPIACAGIMASGAHLRYRRVRVIRFGSLGAGLECFALWSAGANPGASIERVDCVIEDCVVEEPAINQAEMTTCIHMGGAQNASGIQGYHRASVIRNCLIDCEYKFNPAAISSLERSGTTATATTLVPHGRVADDWVRIAGAQVNGSLDNPFNGSFKITSADSTTFQYTMIDTPAANATGEMWVDRFSSHYVPVALNGIAKSGDGPYTVEVTTKTPHFRVPENNVKINNAAPAAYNGSFRVSEVLGPKQLRFVVQTDPGTPTAWGFLGEVFQGIAGDGGSAAVVEGNRIWNTRVGGPYHDTRSTKSLIARNNHYRAVNTGPYQNMEQMSDPTPAATLKHVGKTATFDMGQAQPPHCFTEGQGIRIRDAKIDNDDPPDDTYNGEFAIKTVPTPTSFTYLMIDEPPKDADAASGTVRALWQVQEYRIENNVIELIPSFMNWGSPTGIRLRAVPPVGMTGFRVFRRVIIRNNIIRYVDNLSETTVRNVAIDLNYCEDALVENNVVDLAIADPMRHRNCSHIRYFNNRTPAGQLIQGAYDPQAGVLPRVKQDELTTFIEDATLVCLL